MVVYRKDPNDLDTNTGTTAAHTIDQVSNEGEKTAGSQNSMVPRAVLTSRPNSHPFQERHLVLDQPVKVGRSVARCRPAPNNAIFDCKVLSRNHALLWYENGKFFLQDTKSSNGTFVNNQRLSKGSEESPAREVCSGDIVQFGVDVVENSRKVTHGCIVATLKLFLPDGKEAKASPSTAVVPALPEVSFSSQELHQLSQYLQEALHREQVLEGKLSTLQQVVATTQEASESGWKALIEEDRLLSRIETLEGQLHACSKNLTEERLREEVLRLQEDKDKYQNNAKESLRKVLQEKLEAIRKVQDLENSLSNAEEECTHLREMLKNTEKELQYLVEKNSDDNKEIVELAKKLKEAEDKQQELESTAAEERKVLENQLEVMKKQEQVLSAKIESLQADNDFTKQQLSAMKARFDQLKKEPHLEDNSETTCIPTVSEDHLDISEHELIGKRYRGDLSLEVNALDRELNRVQAENEKNDTSKQLIFHGSNTEDCQPNGDLGSISPNAKADYIIQLQAEIQQLKKLLAEARESKNLADAELLQLKSQLDEAQNSSQKSADEVVLLQQQLQVACEQLNEKTDHINKLEAGLKKTEATIEETKQHCLTSEEKFQSENEQEQNKQEDITTLKAELQEARINAKQCLDELEQLRSNVRSLKEELKVKTTENSCITIELTSLKSECSNLKTRIQSLEFEVKKFKTKNLKLETDSQRLQDTCRELESAKLELENRSGDYWKEQIAKVRRSAEEVNKQLAEAHDEILVLKERYADCNDLNAHMQRELEILSEEFKVVSLQSKMVSLCSAIPLVILLLGILLAFYPSLAEFTATTDQT